MLLFVAAYITFWLFNLKKTANNIPDTNIYYLFINKLQDNGDYMLLFNQKMIEDSVISEKIVIYPNRYIIRFSALNCLLKDKECTFDETYKLCCDYC